MTKKSIDKDLSAPIGTGATSNELMKPTGHTYIKEQSSNETSSFTVGDHVLKFKSFNQQREKDGIRFPYFIKQFEAKPPCSLDIIKNYAKM